MKRLAYLPVVFLLVAWVAPAAVAAPAWGSLCLSCYSQWQNDALSVFGEDTVADPDESGTGAPDRGPLKVFQVHPGETRSLMVEISGLAVEDAYAVELNRLRFPGVQVSGSLAYSGDCAWPEWGEQASYFTEPVIRHLWGTGPTTFSFDIEVEPGTAYDYYDLVFAVAGKLKADGGLFYTEEHFYLQVLELRGDLDLDGDVDLEDFNKLAGCLAGPGNSTPPGGCSQEAFNASDLDDDSDVDLDDFTDFQPLLIP